MFIGQAVLIKYNEKVEEGKVVEIYEEDLKICLSNNDIVMRKYWEVRKVRNDDM